MWGAPTRAPLAVFGLARRACPGSLAQPRRLACTHRRCATAALVARHVLAERIERGVAGGLVGGRCAARASFGEDLGGCGRPGRGGLDDREVVHGVRRRDRHEDVDRGCGPRAERLEAVWRDTAINDDDARIDGVRHRRARRRLRCGFVGRCPHRSSGERLDRAPASLLRRQRQRQRRHQGWRGRDSRADHDSQAIGA